jgi:hypothetical protein
LLVFYPVSGKLNVLPIAGSANPNFCFAMLWIAEPSSQAAIDIA